MKTKPTISVIMAVQNGERFIRQALQSIFDQEYPGDEIIVVHGQSSDKTIDILRDYPQLTVIDQTGRGVSNAYNTGIKNARGNLISFLSYDDTWSPDKLKIQVEFMERNKRILFTNCHISYFVEPGSGTPAGMRDEWLKGSHPARIMETLVARREVFDMVGWFDETLGTAEDVDWYARASALGVPCTMLSDVLLRKRIHGSNSSMNINQNNMNLLRALRSAVKRKQQTK